MGRMCPFSPDHVDHWVKWMKPDNLLSILKMTTIDSQWDSQNLSTSDCHSSTVYA